MLGGFALRYWMSVIDYPLNIGGRPFGELAGVRRARVRDDDSLRVDHGGGRDDRAERAAACRITRCSTRRNFATPRRDRFFLCIETADPKFDAAGDARVSRGAAPGGSIRRCGNSQFAVLVAAGRADARRACRGLPSGHARRAARRSVRGNRRFADGRGMRPLAGRHRRARAPQRRRADVHRQGERAVRRRVPVPGDARACSSAGTSGSTSTARPATAGRPMGNGMIVQRGLRPPPSFHDDKMRNQPVGYYFDVMTNGFGAMQDYRAQVDAEGSLGDRVLHPRAAVQPARHAWPTCRRTSAASSTPGPPTSAPAKPAHRTHRRGTEAMTDIRLTPCRPARLGLQRLALVVGVVGLGLCAVGFTAEPRAVLPRLAARVPVLVGRRRSARWRWMMVHHLSGGAVGRGHPAGVRGVEPRRCRSWRCCSCRSPSARSDLYLWARPEAGRHRRDPAAPGAVPERLVLLRARGASTSLIWIGAGLTLIAGWSRKQDAAPGDDALALRMQRLSGGGPRCSTGSRSSSRRSTG